MITLPSHLLRWLVGVQLQSIVFYIVVLFFLIFFFFYFDIVDFFFFFCIFVLLIFSCSSPLLLPCFISFLNIILLHIQCGEKIRFSLSANCVGTRIYAAHHERPKKIAIRMSIKGWTMMPLIDQFWFQKKVGNCLQKSVTMFKYVSELYLFIFLSFEIQQFFQVQT